MELYVEDTEARYVEVGEQSLSCGGVKGRSEDSVQAAILGITQNRRFSCPGMILKVNICNKENRKVSNCSP